MNESDAVAVLDAIIDTDPEGAHMAADDVLLHFVPPDVAAAYKRVVERVGAWWYA